MGEVSTLKKVLVLTFFFVSGAFSGVLGNVIYNTESVGFHNIRKPFRKPWMQGMLMFLAMSLLVFDTPVVKSCKCPEWDTNGPRRGWGLFRNVGIPALCDLFATLLQNIALLYLTPSVWQMTRGSILLFTALFAIFYRHKKLYAIDWTGVVITILGIVIVGTSSLISPHKASSASDGMQILSMGLIVIAQGLQAFQTIIEEEMLHDVDATENEIVSFEGLWGLIISCFVTLPLAQALPEDAGEGLYENTLESFVMMFRSWPLLLLLIGYMTAILVYNLTGMHVTSFSSAIHRNIYEALRSAAVWALSVIVYYLFPSSGGGEPLSLLSLLQLLGFSISILGSFIYNRVIRLPFFNYHEEEYADINNQ